MTAGGAARRAGRRLDAGLHLLDRQLVDRDGRMAGKVDDLELVERPDGAPYVVAVLSGPGALAPRIGGRLGAWLESVHQRLRHPDRDGPSRISFGVVKRIESHVELTLAAESLDSHVAERWVRDRVVAHVPGAGHAAE